MNKQEVKCGADLIVEYNRLQKTVLRGLKILRDYSGMDTIEEVEELINEHQNMEDFMENVVVEDAQDDINIKNLVINFYINQYRIQKLLDLEIDENKYKKEQDHQSNEMSKSEFQSIFGNLSKHKKIKNNLKESLNYSKIYDLILAQNSELFNVSSANKLKSKISYKIKLKGFTKDSKKQKVKFTDEDKNLGYYIVIAWFKAGDKNMIVEDLVVTDSGSLWNLNAISESEIIEKNSYTKKDKTKPTKNKKILNNEDRIIESYKEIKKGDIVFTTKYYEYGKVTKVNKKTCWLKLTGNEEVKVKIKSLKWLRSEDYEKGTVAKKIKSMDEINDYTGMRIE